MALPQRGVGGLKAISKALKRSNDRIIICWIQCTYISEMLDWFLLASHHGSSNATNVTGIFSLAMLSSAFIGLH
jgi:hypothetical protein